MPRVTANLYATLRKYVDGESSVDVAIEPGQTVEQLLVHLAIPVEQTRIIFCDNRRVETSHRLAGGETVGIFPAVGGG
jgi:molybdopterin converting factor small subunit